MQITTSVGAIKNEEVLLGKLSSANLNVTTDQLIELIEGNKRITRITAVGVSGAITLAAGGLYTGADKSGTILVGAAQAWSLLTAILGLNLTLAANYIIGTTLYLSLTTANGSARTCDIYIYGEVLP